MDIFPLENKQGLTRFADNKVCQLRTLYRCKTDRFINIILLQKIDNQLNKSMAFDLTETIHK